MFKVGDRVTCVRSCPRLIYTGQQYTVRDVNAEFVYLYGVTGGFYHDRFELVRAEPAPTARSNDPATSKGRRKVNKYEQAVLNSLRFTKEGRTGKEIASDEEHPLNCITPRFAPLRRKGLIKDSGERRDKQIVWVLA